MAEAFFTGLGIGLAFWVVTIPALLLLVRGKTTSNVNDELMAYWKTSIENHERQLELYIQLVAATERLEPSRR